MIQAAEYAGEPAIREAIALQGRILLALMLREARTRYGRLRAGYVWAILEPMLHTAGFCLMYSYMGRQDPLGLGMPAFLITGMSTYFGFRNIMGRVEGAYSSNEALFSFPVVKIMDAFLSRALLEIATWIVVTAIFLFALYCWIGVIPRDIFLILASMAMLSMLGFGVGVILSIVTEFIPAFSHFLTLPNRALYFLSGVFYLPENMPPAFREAMTWNPLMHGITLFREGYYPLYSSHLLDIGYLLKWSIGSMLLAFAIERMARKRLRNMVG